jgi:DMSO/TMAO reductase YedYZ molybdopterin-dependent catalytic subunit
MGLRRFRDTTFIIVFIAGCTLSCVKEQPPDIQRDNSKYGIDGISMATPDGGELPRAEEGPVRSALGVPEYNLDAFHLSIAGLVDSSFSLSWEAINSFPASSTDTMIMYCVEGWEVWGIWKGILIKDLLDLAQLQAEGEFVKFAGLDGYTTTLPTSYLKEYNALLAYQVNLAPLRKDDGFPLRLIAYGKYGYKWAKWVTRLEVVSKSQLGFWEKLGFSDQAEVPIERRRFYEGDSIRPLVF